MAKWPVTIGMIVLNEREYLRQNLLQHYPLANKIIIVEGADPLYPKAALTKDGLSTDGTADIVRRFPDPKKKITFIQHGWAKEAGAQAKCELRNRYLQGLHHGLLAVIDADEFYTAEDFHTIVEHCREDTANWAWTYPFLHFWKGHKQFITGGYYDIPHTRFWRVWPGMRYKQNHNWPERQGKVLLQYGHQRRALLYETREDGSCRPIGPTGYHFGFAKPVASVRDKTDYYRNRGECQTRPATIASREAWFLGTDEPLPSGLALHRFGGLLPFSLIPACRQLGFPS